MDLRKVLLLFVFLILAGASCEAGGRILFVPLDNRPVCLSYAVNTLQTAGWEVVTPPEGFIASRENTGQPDKLLDWLEQEAPAAHAAVVSSDALLYGGLVASRTHHTDAKELESRLKGLASLKEKTPGLRLYVFSTIMRTPRASSGGVEPPYYEQYGPDIFRLSALADKETAQGLKKQEREEKQALQAKIPQEVLSDWLLRRMTNLEMNKRLVYAVQDGKFDYFVMGKDDTAPFSQSHSEAREIEQIIAGQRPWNFRMFVGADQLGLLLLTRAVNDMTGSWPFVSVHYADGAGAQTVPSYEDKAVGVTVKEHVYAAGGFPTRHAKRADLALYVNTPYDGVTKEASAPENTYAASKTIADFAEQIATEVKTGKAAVAVADVEFGNGASNAFVMRLLDADLGKEIAAYAGWNTASNSIGYALSQGVLAKYMDENERREMLLVRLTDDWVYQANVRGTLYSELVWPRGIDGTRLDGNKAMLEREALKRIRAFYAGHVPKSVLDGLQVDFPWNRMFEINVCL